MEVSQTCDVTSGVPQGGILSPFLFSLFINDLPSFVDDTVILYADDTQILSSDINLETCVKKMNKNLESISEWAVYNSVIINPDKSQALIFSKGKIDFENCSSIKFNGEIINYCWSACNLGVIFDSDLSWEKHLNHTFSKIYSSLSMLRQTQKVIKTSIRLHLVRSIIIPIFSYGANLFLACSRGLWSKINLCFNACVRYVFNLRKFDSVSSVKNLILGCDLETYLKFHSCLFIFKLLKNKYPKMLYDKISFPKFRRNNLLSVPSHFNKIRERSFFVNSMWNNLPDNVRKIEAFAKFKNECWNFFSNE